MVSCTVRFVSKVVHTVVVPTNGWQGGFSFYSYRDPRLQDTLDDLIDQLIGC